MTSTHISCQYSQANAFICKETLMVIDIREVRPHDKAEWLQLWQGYTRFYGSPQPEEVTECTWQRMLDVNSSVLGRVAVVDDAVVGFAICVLHEGTWVTTPICYLEDLFVDPAFRGQGIARTMIKSLQSEGADKGWSRLYWLRAVIIPPVICMMSLPRLTITYATGSRLSPEAVRGC